MKLNEINKKSVFKTPENYFSSLPARVQARISTSTSPVSQPFGPLVWKVALPAFVIILAVYLIPFNGSETQEFDIDNEALIEYIAESDLTAAQILEIYEPDDETLAGLFDYELSIDEQALESELEYAEIELLMLDEE